MPAPRFTSCPRRPTDQQRVPAALRRRRRARPRSATELSRDRRPRRTGPRPAIPTANAEEAAGRADPSTTLPVTRMSSAASDEDPGAHGHSGRSPSPTRATVLPTTAAESARVSRMPNARRGALPRLATSRTSLLSTATRSAAPLALDRDPGADVGDDVLLDDPRADGGAQRDPGAGAVVDAVAGDPDVARRGAGSRPRRRRSRPAPGGRRPETELTDVRVDGRVGADHDAGAARRDLVADDVERRRRGRPRRSRRSRRPRPRAPRCARRGRSRGTPNSRRGRSRGRARRRRCPRRAAPAAKRPSLSAGARVDAGPPDEHVAPQRERRGRRRRARRPSRRRVARRGTRGRRGPAASRR